jgi:hypothetical protein
VYGRKYDDSMEVESVLMIMRLLLLPKMEIHGEVVFLVQLLENFEIKIL